MRVLKIHFSEKVGLWRGWRKVVEKAKCHFL